MRYSVMIGRWQPLHDGHKALIRKVMEKGNPVLLMIRDTEKDEKNPFSIERRQQMIAEEFSEEMKHGKLRIMVIPDISGVYYGRDVGYEVERVQLDSSIEESVSGTKIREQMRKNGEL